MAWANSHLEKHVEHVIEIFESLAPSMGRLDGLVGFEIGPGDDLGVAYCFLKAGARKMYSVERFDSVRLDRRMGALFEALDERLSLDGARASDVLRPVRGGYTLEPTRMEHRVGRFEHVRFEAPSDFVYSNDVLEHVESPVSLLLAAREALRPGGVFACNVDLSGHNMFSNSERPLDFLTCPDWLYAALTSDIETSNRIRYSEILAALELTGFELVDQEVLRRARPEYLESIREHLLERYRKLSSDDLSVVEVRVVARVGKIPQTAAQPRSLPAA